MFLNLVIEKQGFPGGASGKEAPTNAGDIRDAGLIPGPGRSPEEGHGNPLQYSCLGSPMDRGAQWATAHGVTDSQTQLSIHTPHMCVYMCMYITRVYI